MPRPGRLPQLSCLLCCPSWAQLPWRFALFDGEPDPVQTVRPGLPAGYSLLLKFRTMTGARDAEGNSAPDAARLTNLGRRSPPAQSLDEVPPSCCERHQEEEVSLVGPRPLLVESISGSILRRARRHAVGPEVRVGAGPRADELPWAERLALDVWYVGNFRSRSMLAVLFRTLMAVLRREGLFWVGTWTCGKVPRRLRVRSRWV